MCLYPTEIKNRKYIKNQKNGGVIPAVSDLRLLYVTTKCGNCIECRKQKSREWQIRLYEDIRNHKNGQFVTLTFSNESIKEICQFTIKRLKKNNPDKKDYEDITIKNLKGYDKDNTIATKAVRLFLENWRTQEGHSPRHWLITELGHKGTENIHLHGIIYTDNHKLISKYWKYGYIWNGYNKLGKRINYVNNRTINYITKYITKVDQRNKEYKPKILCTNGIGKYYLNTNEATKNSNQLIETYKTATGHTIYLPTYYRKNLFSEQDRENLTIQKLDKEEIYICGEKISTINQDKVRQLRQWHRNRNAKLGYGQRTNDERKHYEEERREKLINARIKNASGGV